MSIRCHLRRTGSRSRRAAGSRSRRIAASRSRRIAASPSRRIAASRSRRAAGSRARGTATAFAAVLGPALAAVLAAAGCAAAPAPEETPADVVFLNATILTMDEALPSASPEEILGMAERVLLTMVGGRVAFRRDGFTDP